MKIIFTAAICIFAISTSSYASDNLVKKSNATKAHSIIDKKCTTCHSKEKIDLALSSGKDMNQIQKEMVNKGAKLSSNEQEVLGIFWKQAKPIAQSK